MKEARGTSGLVLSSAGLILAAILAVMSFWAANTSLLCAPGIALGLAVLAIAQMGIHLVFFLQITTGADHTYTLALAFSVLVVLVVLAGTLWIMSGLHEDTTPATARIRAQEPP